MASVSITSDTVANHEALLLRATEAAQLCGVGLRTWRFWDAAGHIPQPVRIGRNVFWRRDELADWIASGCPIRTRWQARRQ